MPNDAFEQVSSISKLALGSAKELSAINERLADKLRRQQLALVEASLEATAQQLKLAGTSKGYQELLKGQSALLQAFTGKLVGLSQESAGIASEAREALSAWVEKGIAQTLATVDTSRKAA